MADHRLGQGLEAARDDEELLRRDCCLNARRNVIELVYGILHHTGVILISARLLDIPECISDPISNLGASDGTYR